jgi:Helix-turn-helix of DDE superfamily endonuclease
MFYQDLQRFSNREFQRYTGIKRAAFTTMLTILKAADAKQRRKGGPKPKLSVEDRLLLALAYLREYRTFFHIAGDFGVSEATAIRTTHWVENTLMQSGEFGLPKRQEWHDKGTDIDVVLIDATEVEIERPKKSRNATTLVRKRNIP